MPNEHIMNLVDECNAYISRAPNVHWEDIVASLICTMEVRDRLSIARAIAFGLGSQEHTNV